MRLPRALLALTLTGLLSACAAQAQPEIIVVTATPEPTVAATATASPVPTPTYTPTPIQPNFYPDGVNPLTGLPFQREQTPYHRPLMITVSNEGEPVNPQSGLSYAEHVWLYQMEGWAQTRFTAIYWDNPPEVVGSVRSVRLINTNELFDIYDPLLAISGGSAGMNYNLSQKEWIERVFYESEDYTLRLPDTPTKYIDYYHTLFVIPEKLWAEGNERGVNQAPRIEPLPFLAETPAGGQLTENFQVDFPGLGPRMIWAWDEDSARWLQSTEYQNVIEPKLREDIDYLNGERIGYENVVLIDARYWLADFIEDQQDMLLSVGVDLRGEGTALLLRDGRRYEVTWRREDYPDPILFYVEQDGEQEILPYHPGRTLFIPITTDERWRPVFSFDVEIIYPE